MPSEKPVISKDAMYLLLRVDNVAAFNIKKEAGSTCELRGVNLRGLDLRGLNADGLDFSDSYFRNANLRGIDFSQANLRGASLRGAKVAGCLFPMALTATELQLSLEHGTRLRYTKD